jgi:hypothetical protein
MDDTRSKERTFIEYGNSYCIGSASCDSGIPGERPAVMLRFHVHSPPLGGMNMEIDGVRRIKLDLSP